MLKVGFEFYEGEAPLWIEVAKELVSVYDVEISGVCVGNRFRTQLEQSGLPTWNLADYLTVHWADFDTSSAAVRELERQYGNPFMAWFVYADAYIPSYDHETILKMTVGHLRFWEEYFTQETPVAFVSQSPQSLADLTRQVVALERGVQPMGLCVTRMPNGRFCTTRNYEDRWDYVDYHYERLLDRDLEPDEREQAESFLEAFRESAMVPGYMHLDWPVPTAKPNFVRGFFERLYNWHFEGWGRGYDYITLSPWVGLMRYGRILVKANLMRHAGLYANLFEDPHDDEPFVLFPLHFQPEASTRVRAPYFLDQPALIENLARSIPLSHKLYVKEHKSSLGRRDRAYYRRIASLPNVRLVSPFANTRRLIQQAEAIIVITSTVGWEGLLYERPVVVLGNTFYNPSGLAYRVTDIHQLPGALQRTMTEHRPDREKLLKFIAALFKGSHEGNINVPLNDSRVMARDNIENLAQGIYLDITDATKNR
jgi:hypothetical protein